MPTIKEMKRRVTGSLENETVERVLYIAPDTGEEATVYQYAVDLMYRILGGSSPIGPQMVRRSPFFDPYLKGCYASEVEINGGLGYFKTGETPSAEKMLTKKSYYEGIEFIIRYKSLEAEQDQGGGSPTQDQDEEIELATEQWDFGAQNLTQTDIAMMWSKHDSLTPPQEPIANEEARPVKTIPKMDYTLTRNYVTNLPRTAISALLGKVNGTTWGKAPKKGVDRTYAAETLRFDGATISRRITSKKVEYFKVAYKFAHNPIWEEIFTAGTVPPDVAAKSGASIAVGFVGWNRIWRQKYNWWEYVYAATGSSLASRKLYKYDTTYDQPIKGVLVSGFNLLFHPAAT